MMRGREGGATTVQTQLKPQVHQALLTQRRERLAPQFLGVPASLDARVARAIELFRVCGHHRHAKRDHSDGGLCSCACLGC